MEDRPSAFRRQMALALLPVLLLSVARLAGPEDLDDNDQAKQALYMLDVWKEGNWILPVERESRFATKPPLFTWLGVIAAAPAGGPTELTCRLPSVLAAFVVAGLVFALGAERWGAGVGVAAAWIFALSRTTVRLAVHVRPDMVMTALVVAAFYALHRQERGRGRGMPFLFWAAASLSVLAKGPVGLFVLLGAAAALAFSRRWRPAVKAVVLSRWAGLLALPVAWLALAYAAGGTGFLKGTLFGETVDRVLGTGKHETKSAYPGNLIVHYVGKFLPWSLVSLAGLAAVFSRKTPADVRDRLAFPVAWFGIGLVILNVSRGQREDYLLPLLPAMALAAAALLADGANRVPRVIWTGTLAAVSVGAAVLGVTTLAGVGFGSKALLDLVEQAGPAWGWGLLVCAVPTGVAAAAALRKRSWPGFPPAFGAGVLGMFLLILVYYETASPVARSGRGADVRRLAASVTARVDERDEVLFHGASNAMHFFLGRNRASLSVEELDLFLAARTAPARRYLLTAESAAVVGRYPGRFEVVLSQELRGDPKRTFALLKDGRKP